MFPYNLKGYTKVFTRETINSDLVGKIKEISNQGSRLLL